jgi:hypothetical protein
MSHLYTKTPSGAWSSSDVERDYLASRTGIEDGHWVWINGWDWPNVGASASGGTGAVSYTVGQGAVQCTGGAAAGGSYDLLWGDASVTHAIVPGGTSAVWGITARMSLPDGTINSNTGQAASGVGTVPNSIFLRMGGEGDVSADKYILNSDGGSIVTDMAIDTSVHTFRAYRVGGTTSFEIDGAVKGTSTTAFMAAATKPRLRCYNGSGTGGQKINNYWLGLLVPKV